MRTHAVTEALTWDCGYAAPTARMQYSASSFADLLVGLTHFAGHVVYGGVIGLIVGLSPLL